MVTGTDLGYLGFCIRGNTKSSHFAPCCNQHAAEIFSRSDKSAKLRNNLYDVLNLRDVNMKVFKWNCRKVITMVIISAYLFMHLKQIILLAHLSIQAL